MVEFVAARLPNRLGVWALVLSICALVFSVILVGLLFAAASTPMAITAFRRPGRPRAAALSALVISIAAVALGIVVLATGLSVSE